MGFTPGAMGRNIAAYREKKAGRGSKPGPALPDTIRYYNTRSQVEEVRVLSRIGGRYFVIDADGCKFHLNAADRLPDSTPITAAPSMPRPISAESIRLRQEDGARAYAYVATRNTIKAEAERLRRGGAVLAESGAALEQRIINEKYNDLTGADR